MQAWWRSRWQHKYRVANIAKDKLGSGRNVLFRRKWLLGTLYDMS